MSILKSGSVKTERWEARSMVTIVIPVFNQHDTTEECIRAILDNTQDCEIVIVDNGSSPPIRPPFSGFIETRVIRNEENKGFPVAVNQGIRDAKGDTIILLNNDVIVTPGWAERLTARLDEGYSLVGPLTNYCAGMQQVQLPAYANRDDLDKEASYLSEQCNGEVEEVNWIIGFCMAFRKALFDEIGPFDESLWPCSGEEIDFCFRAREAGHRIGIAQDVYLHHEGSQTFKDMQEAGTVDYQEICKRNDEHLAEKWGKDFWQRQPVTPPAVEGIRLNMGSGPFPMEGFINVDQYKHVNPDICCDVLAVPFDPGTVAEIYAGHILEHFRFDEGQRALRYWLMLLKPGGMISVVVPDYDYLVKQYMADPTPEKLIKFNDLFIYSGVQPSPHQYAYSAALLEKCMRDAGFVNIERMPGDHHYLPRVDHPDFPYGGGWQVGFSGVRP
jgi:GT2 family glycosyltransferase/predicted SAM-dependent methyltransferase